MGERGSLNLAFLQAQILSPMQICWATLSVHLVIVAIMLTRGIYPRQWVANNSQNIS
jgi:hypothetical protein